MVDGEWRGVVSDSGLVVVVVVRRLYLLNIFWCLLLESFSRFSLVGKGSELEDKKYPKVV